MENKCAKLSNCSNEFKSKSEHEKFLREYPALFNRKIMYEVLAELGIRVRMCEGVADHTIALYASGFAETATKMTSDDVKSHHPHVSDIRARRFTVLSKTSCFNVYNLEAGYLSTKYLTSIFKNAMNKNNTTADDDLSAKLVPVFHLKSALSYFGLKNHLSWIYFCILLGNTDDPELSRNYRYLEFNGLDMKLSNVTKLIENVKTNEKTLEGEISIYFKAL